MENVRILRIEENEPIEISGVSIVVVDLEGIMSSLLEPRSEKLWRNEDLLIFA